MLVEGEVENSLLFLTLPKTLAETLGHTPKPHTQRGSLHFLYMHTEDPPPLSIHAPFENLSHGNSISKIVAQI